MKLLLEIYFVGNSPRRRTIGKVFLYHRVGGRIKIRIIQTVKYSKNFSPYFFNELMQAFTILRGHNLASVGFRDGIDQISIDNATFERILLTKIAVKNRQYG